MQLIETKDRLGRLKEQKQYDSSGTLLEKLQIAYDPKGNKIKETVTILSKGQYLREAITTFAYDCQDRLITEVEAFGTEDEKTTHFAYDVMGRKTMHKKPGTTLYFSYDALGRLTQKWSHNLHYSIIYDKMGRLIALKNELTQKATLRSYDLYGNIIKETLESGLTLNRTFDLLDRVIKTTLPDGSTIDYLFEGNELKTIKRSADKTYFHHYNHDNQGRLISEELPFQAGRVSYTYEATSRWMGTYHDHLKQEALGYDPVYNLKGIRFNDEKADYDYDPLNQLIKETYPKAHHYSYDSLQNRIDKDNKEYNVNTLNQLISQSDTHYSYDSNGNLASIASKGKTLFLFYDALDRLIMVEREGERIHYDYDGFNRRLSKTNQQSEELYLYDGAREIGSFREGKPTILRILGPGIGSSEAHATIAIEKEKHVYTPLHHPFGHLALLLDAETGNPLQYIHTTAFGECQLFGSQREPLPLSASISPWLVSSKRFDAETGFTLYGFRFYSPEIGRWITRDPAGFVDGPNLYAYAQNNPLIYVDPYGLSVTSGVWRGAQAALPFIAIRVAIYGTTFLCPPAGAALNVAFTAYSVYSAAALATQTGSYIANSLNNAANITEGFARIGMDVGEVASQVSHEDAIAIATTFLINKKVGTIGNKTLPVFTTAGKSNKIGVSFLQTGGASKGLEANSDPLWTFAKNLKFAGATSSHMNDPGRYVPRSILAEIILNTKGVPDPKGKDAIMYYTLLFTHNKKYNIEVLYHAESNSIWHFVYDDAALGPLPKIIK